MIEREPVGSQFFLPVNAPDVAMPEDEYSNIRSEFLANRVSMAGIILKRRLAHLDCASAFTQAISRPPGL
jgi:hypothetical protein